MKFLGRSHTLQVSKASLKALTATLATLSALSGSDKRVNQAEVFMLFHVPIVLLHIFDCIGDEPIPELMVSLEQEYALRQICVVVGLEKFDR
jgi:hypothetical protein